MGKRYVGGNGIGCLEVCVQNSPDVEYTASDTIAAVVAQ